MFAGRIHIGLMLALFALLPTGCGKEEVVPCRPAIPAGRIEGVVGHGGVPISATIRASRVAEPGQGSLFVETRADSSGAYRLDVPEGRHVLRVLVDPGNIYYYSAAGLHSDGGPVDTLVVASGGPSIRADFLLSAVRVQVALPGAPDGERVDIRLYKRGGPSYYLHRSEPEEIQDGIARVGFTGVLPGSYRVETNITPKADRYEWQDGERFWIPGVPDSTASPWVDVAPDQVTEVSTGLSGASARIEGEIVSPPLGAGLWYPPEVALFSPDSQLVGAPKRAGDHGQFAISVYLPRPVRVLVWQRGVQQWVGGASFDEATTFPLESGAVVSGIRLVQSALKLETASSGFLMSAARVRLFGPEGDVPVVDVQAWQIANSGRVYAIPNLRPGTYRLRIEPGSIGYAPWVPQWYDRAESRETAAPLMVIEGELVTVPIVLEKGGAIRGEVRDLSSPHATHFVYVTGDDAPVSWTLVYVPGSQLEFSVLGLPDGDWKIGVWRYQSGLLSPQPPAGTVWYPGTTDWESASSLRVRGAGEITGIVVTLP